MKILVTGGAGYIGSHVVHFLKTEGHEPTIYDNLSTGHVEVAGILEIPLQDGDVGDAMRLKKVFETQKYDAVMHFSGSIEVEESCKKPSKYYKNNFCNVLVLLDLMIEYEVKYFVFSSTAAVFGRPENNKPIGENHLKNPISPYGRSKLMVEQILEDYDNAYGLKSVILRYFNAAGNHSKGLIGQSYPVLTHLLPSIFNVILGKSKELIIYGNDYPTIDGTCIRDFIHVYDLAQAHLLALDHTMKTEKSNDYNLGSGKGFSVMQVLNMAKEVTESKIPYSIAPRRLGDPGILVADCTKCYQTLGWKAEYDLSQMITSAWIWKQNPRY